MMVTVGIITLNESKVIDGLLEDLLAQDYDKKKIELVFADGFSKARHSLLHTCRAKYCSFVRFLPEWFAGVD